MEPKNAILNVLPLPWSVGPLCTPETLVQFLDYYTPQPGLRLDTGEMLDNHLSFHCGTSKIA